MKARTFAILLFACASAGGLALRAAELAMPPIFSDHMVLQQGVEAPLWGTAAPGDEITVTFRDQTKKTKAGAEGQWSLRLGKMQAPAEQPGFELRVKAGESEIVFGDVVIGEVWIGAGQSNVIWLQDKALVAEANYPQLRLSADTLWPSYHTPHGGWALCTPESAAKYSALLFHFGVRLQKELKVPVGVICRGVGGSAAGSWVSNEAFLADPGGKAEFQRYMEETYPKMKAEYEQRLAAWEKDKTAAAAAGKPEPRKPLAPHAPSLADGPGFGEYWKRFVAPLVGPGGGYGLRGMLWDQGEGGSGLRGVPLLPVWSALVASWRKEWRVGEFPFIFVQKPSGGGWEWTPEAKDNKGQPLKHPEPPALARVDMRGGYGREEFQHLLKIPGSAMCTALDLGAGLHPARKDLYGQRLAAVALVVAYGRPGECLGPTCQSHVLEGNKVRITFAHTGKGLVSRGTENPQGFMVAGKDRVFQWAEAKIEGSSVVVSSDKVQEPVAVRYAWDGNPTWANLFNADGYPALTFRTDDWNP